MSNRNRLFSNDVIASNGFAALILAVMLQLPIASWAESREFNMTIDEVKIHVAPNLDYKVFGFDDQVPGPLIHVKEGDEVSRAQFYLRRACCKLMM